MPRRVQVSTHFSALVDAQDQLVTRNQALAAGMTRHAVSNCVAYDGWQEVLPNVFLTHAGEMTRRQMLVAALLWAGPDAAIDGSDACRFYGIRAVAVDEVVVHIAVPPDSGARSKLFVKVRRSSAPLTVVRSAMARYVDPATAVVVATREMRNERAVLAAFSDAVQRRTCSPDDLLRAHVQGPPRNALLVDRALAAVTAGVRSAPEGDFRTLAEASVILPRLLYNPLLQLPCGRRTSPDALALDAALVHETNGRRAHAGDDLFEDMQERHDAMTAAGLTVLHNSPRRLKSDGRRALAEFERCYLRLKGGGLPAGVILLTPSARRAG